VLRERAGLEIENLGAPMDVLWMRISKQPGDPEQTLGHVEAGKILFMIDRGDYWQCAFIIPKGAFNEIREKGMEHFRAELAEIAPSLSGRIGDLRDWDDIQLLTVAVDRLKDWYRQGLLCIGDAAHAMSPIGGVGINLAIQDAVAAANILAAPLLRGAVTIGHLREVQRRRELPTRLTQRMQVFLQENVIRSVLSGGARTIELPFAMKLLRWFPILRRIPARVIGMGFRPEHVSAPVVK
jgi:2-polyprenyl-6-methoxyphenol hydroxylase-like FAD-dependent oxidoreductase